jgi:hypothetical protein
MKEVLGAGGVASYSSPLSAKRRTREVLGIGSAESRGGWLVRSVQQPSTTFDVGY